MLWSGLVLVLVLGLGLGAEAGAGRGTWACRDSCLDGSPSLNVGSRRHSELLQHRSTTRVRVTTLTLTLTATLIPTLMQIQPPTSNLNPSPDKRVPAPLCSWRPQQGPPPHAPLAPCTPTTAWQFGRWALHWLHTTPPSCQRISLVERR